MTYPFAETLTVVPITTNNKGDVEEGDPADVDGCVVWPGSSTEDTDHADTVVADLTALLPVGTVVGAATHRIRRSGRTYEIDGEPDTYRNPFTGTDPGVLVRLRRVTG